MGDALDLQQKGPNPDAQPIQSPMERVGVKGMVQGAAEAGKAQTEAGATTQSLVDPITTYLVTSALIPGGKAAQAILKAPAARTWTAKMLKEMGLVGLSAFFETGNANHAETDIRDMLVAIAGQDQQMRQAFREMLTAEDKDLDRLVVKFTSAGVGGALTAVPFLAGRVPALMLAIRKSVGRMSGHTADALMDSGTGTFVGVDGSLYRYATEAEASTVAQRANPAAGAIAHRRAVVVQAKAHPRPAVVAAW